MKLCVLGLSARTNGELTMALDVATRLRPAQLHAVVGTPSVTLAASHGARVHPFPLVAGPLAFRRIVEHVKALEPDVILLADLALLHLSTELGPSLLPLAHVLPTLAPTVALDLYDWDTNAATMDTFGVQLHQVFGPVPANIGRLLPCPMHPPQDNTPGHGFYRVMEDSGPLSTSERTRVRQDLGLSGPVVLWTTSAWQHPVHGRMHMAPHQTVLPQAAAGQRIMEHFPMYALRLLDRVSARVGGVTLLHVGPLPFPMTDDLTSLRYVHRNTVGPEVFLPLLGSVDLLFNPNTPASSAWRATTMRVPVLSVHQHAAPTSEDPALRRYQDATPGAFAWSVWPVGLHNTVHNLLRPNPTAAAAHVHANALQPEVLVEAAVELLKNPGPLQHAQGLMWRGLEGLDHARALLAALSQTSSPPRTPGS